MIKTPYKISDWVWQGSVYEFSDDFVKAVLLSPEIVAAFDSRLNYLFVNKATCDQLNCEPASLLGKNITEVYPNIIASRNHRNFLRAVDGETIHDIVDGRISGRFESIYTPVIEKGVFQYLEVRARKL